MPLAFQNWRATRLVSLIGRANRLDRRWILKRRKIAKILDTKMSAPNDASQNLGIARFRQLTCEANGRWPQRRTQHRDDLIGDGAAQYLARFHAWSKHHEDGERLTFQVVGDTNRDRFKHRGVSDRRRFDFGRSQSFAGDFDRVI